MSSTALALYSAPLSQDYGFTVLAFYWLICFVVCGAIASATIVSQLHDLLEKGQADLDLCERDLRISLHLKAQLLQDYELMKQSRNLHKQKHVLWRAKFFRLRVPLKRADNVPNVLSHGQRAIIPQVKYIKQ